MINLRRGVLVIDETPLRDKSGLERSEIGSLFDGLAQGLAAIAEIES